MDVRANHLDCKEPKENANDLAVQVWEEKKRSDIARKEREIKDLKLLSSASTSIAKSIETGYCDIHFAPSSTSDSRSSRNIEAASEASPPEDNVSRPAAAKDINRNSSLFFTPESEVGSQQQGGEDEAPREIPETQLVDSTVPAPSLPYLSQAFLYGEIPYNSQPFEYFRGSSIPSEYKLPEEVEPVIKKESSPTPFSTDSDATDSSDWSFNSADEVKYWKDFDTEQEEPAVDEVAETQIAEQPPEPQNSVFPLTDSGQRALSQLENKMDKKSPRKPLSYDEIMEKYRDVPGSTPTEKLRNSHAEMRARILDSFGTIRASARLSESPIRASSAEITQSLGGADKAPAPPSQMNPVPEPLSHPAELPSPKHEEGPVQTIQPSALTVTYTEPPPGSVQLGPSEYAISLPMDSRVKDDYESVLGHEARTIVDFLSGFDPHSKLPEDEVSVIFQSCPHLTVSRINNFTRK